MKQFSIRLPDELIAGLDAQVAAGQANDRMDAIRRAVRLALVSTHTERAMAEVRWAEKRNGN